MSKAKINGIILFLAGVVILYYYLEFRQDRNLLRKDGVIQKAMINGRKTIKSTLLIEYSFDYGTKIYEESKDVKRLGIKQVDNYLLNKEFPLILRPSDPTNNDLLLFKEDFEKYGLSYPDSLKWLCDSLRLRDCN